ncbi:hypothetical protein PBV87_11085 [Niameybacter massiliensis]|uniref:Uncharacterized protein n=1 Tax=Holtiella tumoricola TaxID=3018743 RepID=A0AA42DN17_9FIRM|nr:hypothetical protein [Holtiella tumoricola]MDA3732025.1 hypothetical protein [Holtiella tumoricola]
MFNYAQINEQGYCIGISSLTNEVVQENMILIEQYDNLYISRKYDKESKQWTDEYLSIIDPQAELTLQDIKKDTSPIKATTSLTADDTLTIMEYQTALDEKLSKIITHLGL